MMRRLRWGAALLALVLVTGGSGPAVAADESPDLRIELLPFNPNSPRQVVFKVTNDSEFWADKFSVTIDPVSPTPGNQLKQNFNDLDEKTSVDIKYTLAADCKPGHKLTATVSTAVNYAGVPESNTANNKLTAKEICPAASQAAPSTKAESVTKPAGANPGTVDDTRLPGADAKPPGADGGNVSLPPEHLRPGTHELEFEPNALRSLARITTRGTRGGPYDDTSDPDDLSVGWDENDPVYDIKVWQTAVNFDLAKLLEVDRPAISEAHLSFVEHENEWVGADGRRADVVGCVSVLGMATNDWALPLEYVIAPDLLFRNRYLTDVFLPKVTTDGEPGRIHRWRAFDVTSHLRSQTVYRDDPDLWFGYVLRGALDDDDGANTSCASRVSDIRLWVTYVVRSR